MSCLGDDLSSIAANLYGDIKKLHKFNWKTTQLNCIIQIYGTKNAPDNTTLKESD